MTTKLNGTLQTPSVYHWKSNRKAFSWRLFLSLFMLKGTLLVSSIYLIISYVEYFSVYFLKMCINSVSKNLVVEISGKKAITFTKACKKVQRNNNQKPQTWALSVLIWEYPPLLPQLTPQQLDSTLTQSQEQIILSQQLETNETAWCEQKTANYFSMQNNNLYFQRRQLLWGR